MTIPLLNRGRAKRASSADLPPSSRSFFRFRPTPKFRNPLPHPARVAVLRERFTGNHLKTFHPTSTEHLISFRPGILAGSLEDLRLLAADVTASKAMVVFCSGPLAEAERNWLWQRFALPCFEQILDQRGHVIAEECEVHAGLHVLAPDAIAGTLTSVECECGRSEPRLVPVR